MTTDPTAAAIARGLTEAQKRAVLSGTSNMRVQEVLRGLKLIDHRRGFLLHTPLGLRVREELANMGKV